MMMLKFMKKVSVMEEFYWQFPPAQVKNLKLKLSFQIIVQTRLEQLQQMRINHHPEGKLRMKGWLQHILVKSVNLGQEKEEVGNKFRCLEVRSGRWVIEVRHLDV